MPSTGVIVKVKKQKVMVLKISTGQIFQFCKKNWFKITVVVLGLYVFFIKDLSFQVQVQMPDGKEQAPARHAGEKMTEAASTASVDRLELPFIGGRKQGRNGLSELSAISEPDKRAYLQRFAKVANQEQDKYGIPASVILATSLYQSCAGKRDVTLQANNQFGLPCGSDWRGACRSVQGESFRRYESAWASFRDFSNYATAHFAELKGGDFKAWAAGMQKSGFGGDEAFAKNIIAIIEGYRLQELDE